MIAVAEFETIRDLVYKVAGIVLNENKQALVSARVSKRLRALKLESFSAYLEFLKKDKSGDELIQLMDVISTNFTSFFREPIHFQFLENFLKERLQKSQRTFRIWSAAASTGEEPWSLAMTMNELLPVGSDWKILATDISKSVLGKCRNAYYDAARVKTVNSSFLQKYFRKEGNDGFRVISELQSRVRFCMMNLSTPPFLMSGPFDCIFCRNVMIYFDNVVRQRLISEMIRLLAPGGLLIVGHSESLNGVQHSLQTLAPSVYQKGVA